MILCWMIFVSSTTPRTSPVLTSCPTSAVASNHHFFSWSNAGNWTPRLKKLLCVISMNVSNGRWIPSNICEMIPGANSTDNASPVERTGSPGPIPEVSSYTCIDATSPRISMISPMTPSSPTKHISWILASDIFFAITRGPETFMIFPICNALSPLHSIRYFVQLLFPHSFGSLLRRSPSFLDG